jgi:hypothetical protein
MPVLYVDYNELRSHDGYDLMADVDSWKLKIGQRVIARDYDGLKCEAVVCGPWFAGGKYVGVNLDGEYDYSECAPAATQEDET